MQPVWLEAVRVVWLESVQADIYKGRRECRSPVRQSDMNPIWQLDIRRGGSSGGLEGWRSGWGWTGGWQHDWGRVVEVMKKMAAVGDSCQIESL